MADFVTKSTVKSAERVLATPFASKDAMNTIVNGIITNNPWSCTSYASGGVTLPAVQKSSEYYTGKIVYENGEGKQVGYVSIRAGTSEAFDSLISTVLANTTMAASMGGTASHDSSEDSYSVTLKCHTETGELYNVAFKRDRVSISSFESDSILTTIETWADTVSALA